MKQAKIAISLDIKPAKAEIGKLKDVFKQLGNDLKGVFSKDLHDQVKIFENLIGGCTDRLHDLHKASEQALNPKIIANYVDQYRALSSVIGRVARQQQAFGRNVTIHYPQTPGMQPPTYAPAPTAPQPNYTQPGGGGGGSGGGGGGGGGGEITGGAGLGSLIKGASKALGAIGIGFGVHAAIERELEHAEAGIRVRELTGGSNVGGRSRFGFTRMERLQRAGSIAGQGGRDMSNGEISGLVNQSEQYQRAFGITGEGFSSAYGASRRAGAEKPGESIANAIGDAVSMKMSGSAVGEYLQQMAGYLDQMSKGVNVDEKSLRGFATSLGDMNFFRGHPERIFDAMGKLDTLFKGGGTEFQNFSMYRATQEVATRHGRPLTPSGVANRRAFGLFGNSAATLKGFSEAGMPRLGKELGGGGDEEIQQFLGNAFKEATQGGRGKDSQEAFQLFRETTGLEAGQAAGIYQTLGKGKKLSSGQVKQFQNAQRSPEQRSEDTMKSYEGAVKAFGEDVDNIKNIVSENIMTAAIKMDDAAVKFDDAVNKYISKVLGVEEKAPYGEAAEAFTKAGTAHGFAPTADEAAGYAKTEQDAYPLLRGIHANSNFKMPYDKLNDDQKAKVDREVQAHLERSRQAQLRKEAEHIQAYQRFRDMGKDFEPKTSAEKDIAKDADDLSAEDMAAKYDRPIIDQDKFDAFVNDADKKARGGLVGLKGGGQRGGPSMGDIASSITWKDVKEAVGDMFSSGEASAATGNQGKKWNPSLWDVAKDITWKDVKGAVSDFGKARGGIIGLADGSCGTYDPPDDHDARVKYNAWWNENCASDFKTKDDPGKRDLGLGGNINRSISAFMHSGEAKAGKAAGGSVGMSSIRGIGRGSSNMGTDTLLTALTPGEFVVNARDASRNMLALQHANAGGRISPYADGGCVGSGGSDTLASALSGFPQSLKLDSGSHENAINANTHAIHTLARALGGPVGMRDVPRGPRLKYG